MLKKTKKFQSLVIKINSYLNEIISEINKISQQQTLFNHTITIKLNSESKTLNFYLNDKHLPSNEIQIEPNYLNDILKQLNEIMNKVHFINYHIRIVLLDEISNEILLELPSQSLKIPSFSEITKTFGDYFGEKKLEQNNILIKKFREENDKYKIELKLCYIFHNFAKYGTFDLLLFNNRLYDLYLSKNENIINELKNGMFFDLSDDNIFINFNKLKDSSINLFIFGNFIFNKKEGNFRDGESLNDKEKENKDDDGDDDDYNIISKFIINSMNSMNEQFYEKIKIFSENRQMNFYFDSIVSCLKEIYTSTNDQELFEVYSKLFEPTKDDPQYVHKKLAKNFMLCSQKQ